MNRLVITAMAALGIGVFGLTAQQKQPTPKSKGEVDALQAMFQAQDPDARIKAAENLITKYADTDFKALAFYFTAISYEQKNDRDKMIIYAERAVEADPKHYASLLMLAKGIAQSTREHDLDREEKLKRAEKYAKDAVEILKDAPKPNPQISDEQWAGAKKDYVAQAHEALGLAALARKDNNVAIAEFRTAIESAAVPDPATMVRLGAAYDQSGKYDEAIAILDKVMAMTEVHPAVKQFAQAERVRAMQAKGQGAKPAAPAAPPQVEVKKP